MAGTLLDVLKELNWKSTNMVWHKTNARVTSGDRFTSAAEYLVLAFPGAVGDAYWNYPRNVPKARQNVMACPLPVFMKNEQKKPINICQKPIPMISDLINAFVRPGSKYKINIRKMNY